MLFARWLNALSGRYLRNPKRSRLVNRQTVEQLEVRTLLTGPTALSIDLADTVLLAGETSLVTFTFDQAVTGFTSGDLTIGNGTLLATPVTADGVARSLR